ncbi:MFS transporter [Flavobacterium sp.]|uniref:MFS transporter n=1 Tax=Flavobacterium sp. TaxID=239 RepID=UPI0037523FB2
MNKFQTKVNRFQTDILSLRKTRKGALSESSLLRYFTFSSLYAAQGIPEGLTFFAIPAWMAMQGKSPTEIRSFIGIIGIPWSFKILIAPVMDRYTFLPMGRKRPWILLGQFGLVISLLSASLINDPLNNLSLLMAAGFFISFFGAFQDVAVDGMAIDIVPIDEQARANGLMWGSKTIGISFSLVTCTWIINNYGFHYAAVFLALIVACIFVIPLMLRENIGEKIMPWSKGEACERSKEMQVNSLKMIFKNLIKVFFLPTSLIMGIAVFFVNIGSGLMDSLLPVFTIQKIGWTDSSFSQVMAIANVTAGLLGMFIGGALVDFFGKIRMMSIYLILLIVLTVAIVVFKFYWSNQFFIPGFIFFYNTLYTFLQIAIFATAMELCWKRISATQFTLYMAIGNLGRAAGAGYLGEIKTSLVEWEYVILVYTGSAIIMLMLVIFIKTEKHLLRVNQLENNNLIP